MKKTIFILLLVLVSTNFAQIESFDSDYIDEVKADAWGTYVEIIGGNLALTDEQAQVFTPLLESYIADQTKVADMRIENTKEYMMNYYDLDDATATKLINKGVEIEQERLNIRREYVDKMLEKLPPQIVGKFLQLDVRIFALIDLVRMSSIPLVRQGDE